MSCVVATVDIGVLVNTAELFAIGTVLPSLSRYYDAFLATQRDYEKVLRLGRFCCGRAGGGSKKTIGMWSGLRESWS